ncbi:MAG TPA: NAD(P)-dependent alcohol dehydrogenase [Candidatus Dormibacteraeota bacterium]|nr:NAD(P)-dependent alcohol dehydrogenase [Candidatus Dormibacteraeota bacterium]
MKAMLHRCYGPPSVLTAESIEKPVPADDQLLVHVHAASVNPLDWHYLRGTPYLVRLEAGFGRPGEPRLGVDFAGTVEAVGKAVKRFKPGDDVFGGKFGAFAEYVVVREERAVVLKPANVSFEQAAAVPIAALTALQGLRDKGALQPGQKVLINGASGGVGTFAVQLAKVLGAEVTGVCSTRNVELVRSLGADHVIDYTREDFTRLGQRYDVIFDTVGNHPLLEYRKVMTAHGIFVIVGGPSSGNWIGPMSVPLKAVVLSPFVSQQFKPFLAELTPQDLKLVADLMQAGKVTSVIDRRYPLAELPAAIAYLEAGHARGKVIINID